MRSSQMVSRSDQLWSAPRSLSSVNQLYFSQFTNCICHNLSTVFLAIYQLHFSQFSCNLFWLHCSEFSQPNVLQKERMAGWSPDQPKCQITLSSSTVFLDNSEMYLSILANCISSYVWSAPMPPDSLGRPITQLISWFPPREQYLIVQSWQISADHVCLSSRLQIEFLSFCEISNTF